MRKVYPKKNLSEKHVDGRFSELEQIANHMYEFACNLIGINYMIATEEDKLASIKSEIFEVNKYLKIFKKRITQYKKTLLYDKKLQANNTIDNIDSKEKVKDKKLYNIYFMYINIVSKLVREFQKLNKNIWVKSLGYKAGQLYNDTLDFSYYTNGDLTIGTEKQKAIIKQVISNFNLYTKLLYYSTDEQTQEHTLNISSIKKLIKKIKYYFTKKYTAQQLSLIYFYCTHHMNAFKEFNIYTKCYDILYDFYNSIYQYLYNVDGRGKLSTYITNINKPILQNILKNEKTTLQEKKINILNNDELLSNFIHNEIDNPITYHPTNSNTQYDLTIKNYIFSYKELKKLNDELGFLQKLKHIKLINEIEKNHIKMLYPDFDITEEYVKEATQAINHFLIINNNEYVRKKAYEKEQEVERVTQSTISYPKSTISNFITKDLYNKALLNYNINYPGLLIKREQDQILPKRNSPEIIEIIDDNKIKSF